MTRVEIVDGSGQISRALRLGPRDTVRDALVRARVPHRSRCQGSSICGTCWVEVLDDPAPPPAPDEAALLQRHAAGARKPRLACRLVPEPGSTVRIRVPAP